MPRHLLAEQRAGTSMVLPYLACQIGNEHTMFFGDVSGRAGLFEQIQHNQKPIVHIRYTCKVAPLNREFLRIRETTSHPDASREIVVADLPTFHSSC